jgi:hypothetical protein
MMNSSEFFQDFCDDLVVTGFFPALNNHVTIRELKRGSTVVVDFVEVTVLYRIQ